MGGSEDAAPARVGPEGAGDEEEGGEEVGSALSAATQALAAAELREDASARAQALAAMRAWLRKHPAIRRCRADAPFLLRFLRTKKFSVPQAQDMLERYLAIRQLYPRWFRRLDLDDPELAEVIDAGYLVPLPERDDFGRQVILSCAGRFDPYKFSSAHMARAHGLVAEALMDDEENQVRGYAYVNDESGLTAGHLSLWSLADIRAMLRCIQNSTPMRHKATHFLNVPSLASKVFEFFIGLLSEKLRARIRLHANVEELQEAVNPRILPKEYGGEVPLADMIAQFKERLREKQAMLRALDDMEIDLSHKASLVSDMEDELGGVAGNFRKLEVD